MTQAELATHDKTLLRSQFCFRSPQPYEAVILTLLRYVAGVMSAAAASDALFTVGVLDDLIVRRCLARKGARVNAYRPLLVLSVYSRQ